MEYESANQGSNKTQQAASRHETPSDRPCRTLEEQVMYALPPLGKKRNIASDFGVGPPPLLSY